MKTPNTILGLRHVAFFVEHFELCEQFYVELLGMKIVWRPDADNVYLSSGSDNLALHRATQPITANDRQRLDHIGFFLKTPDDVDAWYEVMKAAGVTIKAVPKTHRDGARSFYCADPDGNVIQMIHMPGIML